jgi:hypothetical protein
VICGIDDRNLTEQALPLFFSAALRDRGTLEAACIVANVPAPSGDFQAGFPENNHCMRELIFGK